MKLAGVENLQTGVPQPHSRVWAGERGIPAAEDPYRVPAGLTKGTEPADQ